MNNREERKHRLGLTLSVTIYIFFIMTVTVLIAFVGVSVLMALNKLPLTLEGRPNPKYILSFMVVVNLIVGLCITTLANRIALKHINKIINQMNRLAAGDFKARLKFKEPFCNHPTVREITNSFNCMAEELENTEMLRSDFINNFSHEFKTPIVSIAGFAKLLKRGNLTEQQKKEYLEIIEEESLRLSAMATNVLNMTRVENQTILTDISKFNISEQIRGAILLLENAWAKKKIEFNLEFGEYEISANEELLKQVWINLIGNAINFSPEYGEITIKINEDNERYIFSITNPGNEIPIESREKIFDKFYQVDESHSTEGNGIGLAIVKRVIELHGGNVRVECRDGIIIFIVELYKKAKIL